MLSLSSSSSSYDEMANRDTNGRSRRHSIYNDESVHCRIEYITISYIESSNHNNEKNNLYSRHFIAHFNVLLKIQA